ncbi:unnamed protein product [Brassica napus]|uniref:(rape) hypothetical protein n=1 Tax=Brassica napus TaxID=3708 RepID=A0A817B7W2_BRANA|nr:unnamed protein product [Brassica napus]
MKVVKCKKVKHHGRRGRKGKPRFLETCMRRNLGILRMIIPGCEEVEGRSLDSQVNSTSHASQISGYFT